MVVALVSGEREELGGPDTDAEAAVRVTLLPATGQPEVTHLFTGECSKVNPPNLHPSHPSHRLPPGQSCTKYFYLLSGQCQFWFVQSKCVVVNIFGEGGEVGLVNLWNDLVLIPLFHKLIYTCMLHLLHVWPQTWNSVT